MTTPGREDKVCPRCGRRFSWRKRWARDWAEVVYCSARCRSKRNDVEGADLEARILALLATRARGATICPSEVVSAAEKQSASRMEEVRSAARRLAHRAAIDVVQKGSRVDPDTARGPKASRRKSLGLVPAQGRPE